MFDSNQFFSGGAAGFYPVSIDQSLRFNDDDSAYLSRTPASAGNRKTWTWSGWVKRGNLGTFQNLFGVSTFSTNNWAYFHFRDGDSIQFNTVISGTDNTQLITTPVYRDTSAWYHIVLAFDTTQATPSNRVKIYVNGLQVTAFNTATYPAENHDAAVNTTNSHMLGRWDTIRYLDGYLAEVHFTDGTAYDADAFGELKSGVWVAKTPSVTYGTNGFYLDFANSADIGNDVSGEGNDWTPNNFTASDVVLDSPTDNFATLNPLHKNTQAQIYSDGNLRFQASGSTTQFSAVVASQTADTGKWYCEYTVNSPSNRSICGFANIDKANIAGAADYYAGIDAFSVGLYSNGGEFLGTTASLPAAGALSDGDVVMLAMNLDDGYLYWGKNGTWFNSADPAAGTSTGAEAVDDIGADGTYAFVFAGRNSMITDVNFGQSGFTYTPPTDYLALSTANLPEPTISPADDASPEDYFNTVLYTGDGADGRAITGVGFQPDWLWVKSRNVAQAHRLYDAVRGSNLALVSNSTGAEFDSSADELQSFDADGFTIDDAINVSTRTYVAWNWKANGSGVSNTDGDITSQVSANTTSGFSIVSYTGNGSASQTVGHGLGVAPSFGILKDRDTNSNNNQWQIFHTGAGDDYGYFTTAAFTGTAQFYPTSGDSDTVTIARGSPAATTNESGDRYIMYLFADVEGFSKFGLYTGNGSLDGPFVYTGFRPAFVMIKAVDNTVATSFQSWKIIDSTRYANNASIVPPALWANGSYAEGSRGNGEATSQVWRNDLLSNGFKLGGLSSYEVETNQSGIRYIYAAFAEQPFKFSNAR